MDKIKKFLKKLSKKELGQVLKAINKFEREDYSGLDIKKLSGHKNIFRARIGNIRILFLQSNNQFRLISIERKSDTTYNI